MKTRAYLSFFAVIAACTTSAKREAQSLGDLVERFRKDDASHAAANAKALAAFTCTDPEVCDAKAACVAYADPFVRAAEARRDAEAALTAVEAKKKAGTLAAGDPEIAQVTAKLDDAEKLAAEVKTARARCEDKLGALLAKYAATP